MLYGNSPGCQESGPMDSLQFLLAVVVVFRGEGTWQP